MITNQQLNVFCLLFWNGPVEVEEQENPNMEVYQSKYMKTVIIRKENFVPYTTRIYTFITSFTDRNNAPQDSLSSPNDDEVLSDTRFN